MGSGTPCGWCRPARYTEVAVTHLAQIIKTDILGIPPHLCNNFFAITHLNGINIDIIVKQSLSVGA